MSANKFELIANNRATKGKLACRRLRTIENQIPAIIYGGQESNLSIFLSHDKVIKMSEHENFYTKILHLIIDGLSQKVVLKDIQRHPFKPKILHLDFQRVKETDVLSMQVPLHFINSDKCPGVKLGGVVNHHANTVEVRCEARFLPEFLEIDLANLELGQIVHLSNLILPTKVEILALAQGKPDSPVVSVQLPKAKALEDSTATTMTEGQDSAAEDKKSKAKQSSSAQGGSSASAKSATASTAKTTKK
jgi:large subunit ribosomal protein L25